MTQLELVEHDLTPCGEGKPIQRTVVAVSSSHTALRDFCTNTYKINVGHENVDDREKYYTIHQSKIAIVPSKI